MLKKTMLVMALVAMMAAQASAQNVYLGPQVGYYKAQGADEGEFMYGGALRVKLMPIFGIEASINYRQEKYGDDVLTVRSWPVMVTGLIYPLPMVYGAAGFGWYNTTLDYDQSVLEFLEDETVQEIGWHFGGGVELPVGENLKLTGDIRYVFLDYDFEEIPGSDDIDSNFYVITAGVLFGF